MKSQVNTGQTGRRVQEAATMRFREVPNESVNKVKG